MYAMTASIQVLLETGFRADGIAQYGYRGGRISSFVADT